jgi:hypothetical protein
MNSTPTFSYEKKGFRKRTERIKTTIKMSFLGQQGFKAIK